MLLNALVPVLLKAVLLVLLKAMLLVLPKAVLLMLLKAVLPVLLVNFESAAAVGFKDKQSHIMATDDDDYDWNFVTTKTHSLIKVHV